MLTSQSTLIQNLQAFLLRILVVYLSTSVGISHFHLFLASIKPIVKLIHFLLLVFEVVVNEDGGLLLVRRQTKEGVIGMLIFGFRLERAGDEFGGCEEINHAIFLVIHRYNKQLLSFTHHIITYMVSCECFTKNNHEPRTKKTEPYKKVNAYTQKPSPEQILTAILFILQLAGHSVFIVPTVKTISNAVLWSMLGFHYALLLVIGYDYIYITTKDPVDRLILDQSLAARYTASFLKTCLICNCQVHKNSHHCMRCNRCTEQFDHHCRFLNNCIGSRNYQAFFRLLLIYTCYNFNVVGMAIWTAFPNNVESESIYHNKWGILAVGGLTLLIEIAVAFLLGFHFYISCYQNMTTYEHNYQPKQSNQPIQKIKINLWGAPNSGERLRRYEGNNIIQKNI